MIYRGVTAFNYFRLGGNTEIEALSRTLLLFDVTYPLYFISVIISFPSCIHSFTHRFKTRYELRVNCIIFVLFVV